MADVQATDADAHNDIVNSGYQWKLEDLERKLGSNEQLLWAQLLVYNTDPAAGSSLSVRHAGLLGLTDQRMLFMGGSAASQWPYSELRAVQYERGGRSIFGAPTTIEVLHRLEGTIHFNPEQKHKAASDRLVHILEEQIREAAIGPPAHTTILASEAAVADEVGKLADLHQQGVLDDEEFASAKARLLDRPHRA